MIFKPDNWWPDPSVVCLREARVWDKETFADFSFGGDSPVYHRPAGPSGPRGEYTLVGEGTWAPIKLTLREAFEVLWLVKRMTLRAKASAAPGVDATGSVAAFGNGGGEVSVTAPTSASIDDLEISLNLKERYDTPQSRVCGESGPVGTLLVTDAESAGGVADGADETGRPVDPKLAACWDFAQRFTDSNHQDDSENFPGDGEVIPSITGYITSACAVSFGNVVDSAPWLVQAENPEVEGELYWIDQAGGDSLASRETGFAGAPWLYVVPAAHAPSGEDEYYLHAGVNAWVTTEFGSNAFLGAYLTYSASVGLSAGPGPRASAFKSYGVFATTPDDAPLVSVPLYQEASWPPAHYALIRYKHSAGAAWREYKLPVVCLGEAADTFSTADMELSVSFTDPGITNPVFTFEIEATESLGYA